jgi:hypothetical protein
VKKLLLGCLLLLVLVTPATADKYDAALAAVKTEPKVKSAAWGPSNVVLFVGVFDDGSRRDGFAEYVGLILVEHGIRSATVHVMDEASALRGEGKILGRFTVRQ